MKLTPDSKFMQLCGKFVALFKINFLWLLCSVPLVTLGASTCAMLTALTALRREEDCGAKVFFGAFRRYFGKATVLWLLMAFAGAVLALDYRLVAYMDFPGRMAVIVLICFCILALVLVAGLIFPLLVRYPGTVRDTVVNAVLLSIAHLPKMLLVTAMNLLPALVLVVLPQVFVLLSFLWPICGFALIALYDLTVTDKIFAALEQPDPEAQSPDGELAPKGRTPGQQ